MKKISRALFFWALFLSACSISVASPSPNPPTITDTPLVAPTTALPNPQECGYQWANQELPELSSRFQASIQALQAGAKARAYAFGEDCLRSDGSNAGFSAKETDFEVTLQVEDLTNESNLGEWIVKVMQVIENIPLDQISGPEPGRVSIGFESNGNQKFVNFYVNQYKAIPAGSNTAEIYQKLQIPQ